MLWKSLSAALAGAVAVVGSASTSTTRAAETIGVYAIGTYDSLADFNNNIFSPLGPSDSPNAVHVHAGQVIALRTYADVTQTGAAGPAGYPVFSSSAGKLTTSTGGVKANFDQAFNYFEPSVTGLASSPGIAQDLDGDGDLDLGSNDVQNPGSGWLLYRSTAPDFAQNGPHSQDPDGSSAYDPGNEPTPLGNNGYRYLLSTEIDLFITDANGPNSVVRWSPRAPGNNPFNGIWFENSTEELITVQHGPVTVTYLTYHGGTVFSDTASGQTVTLIAIPEPGALGLVGSVAIVARRGARRNGCRF